jgi:hypothetical protein
MGLLSFDLIRPAHCELDVRDINRIHYIGQGAFVDYLVPERTISIAFEF